ncbi:hypothetical protein STAS_26909 [Striga asiatica]|uniref:Uncharacterized protein n=1 Tax=Striga asiatica TaxID=4170 RepID=A0A5A7QZU3_STRAF|nr:hypothetical protein STAS_26909 [Striga asiatica]
MYYISGAKVRPEIPLYQVGDYKYRESLKMKPIVFTLWNKCRIPMAIKYETGTIYAMICGADAERIIPFNENDLYEAKKNVSILLAQFFNDKRPRLKSIPSVYHTILKLYTTDHMSTGRICLKNNSPKKTQPVHHQLSQPTASSSITTATPSKQASPKPSQFNLETHTDLPANPSKKSRPKMD